jgi:hypothetical protein
MNSKYILNAAGALVLGIVLLPSTSMAQVFKCKDASGKTAYQSTPCAAAQQESRPVILDSPTLTDEEKFNAAAYSAGMTPKEAKRLLQEGAPKSDQPAADAGQVAAERRAQRDYASSFECRQAQRDIDIARGSVTASQSEKLTNVAAAQRKADLACLGPAGYREAEAARAEARERAKERRARTPGVITNCDPGGCNDNYGNRYHRAGPNLVSGGKTCTPAGSGWSCN